MNISGFIKKMLHHIDALQGSDYFSGSIYTSVLNIQGYKRFLKKCCIIDTYRIPNIHQVLNIPGLHKVLNKTLHYIYLVGF